jgi:glycosyltransferase involved in cell wall biosynthesis
MREPLISILVCTYNRAHVVAETMASIFAQQYQPVEIVVVDDGSTDTTPQLMARYGERIRYHRQSNQGIAAARTRACLLATGEYIAFQDDDDLMPPDRLNVLFDAMREHPSAVLAVGDWATIDESGVPTGQRWLPASGADESGSKLVRNGHEAVLWPTLPVAPHTTLFRRADGEKIGWFDPELRYASEDKDFFARLARLGPIAYVPQVVSHYRRGQASLTQNSLRTEYGSMILFRKHLAMLTPRQHVFARRLRSRILSALERMAMDQQAGVPLPEHIPYDYPREWLPMLGLTDRLHYLWYTQIRAQLRRLVRRVIGKTATD